MSCKINLLPAMLPSTWSTYYSLHNLGWGIGSILYNTVPGLASVPFVILQIVLVCPHLKIRLLESTEKILTFSNECKKQSCSVRHTHHSTHGAQTANCVETRRKAHVFVEGHLSNQSKSTYTLWKMVCNMRYKYTY